MRDVWKASDGRQHFRRLEAFAERLTDAMEAATRDPVLPVPTWTYGQARKAQAVAERMVREFAQGAWLGASVDNDSRDVDAYFDDPEPPQSP